MDLCPEEQFEHIESDKHSAVFYKNQREQLAVAVPFIVRGLEGGEKCIYITSENTVTKIVESIRRSYKKASEALESKQLSVVLARDSYLRKGNFDPQTCYDDIEEFYNTMEKENYRGLRCTGDMDWIFKNFEFLGSLREYEIGLNSQLEKYKNITLLCQYNMKAYTNEYLKDMIMVHSSVISGDFRGGMFPYHS